MLSRLVRNWRGMAGRLRRLRRRRATDDLPLVEQGTLRELVAACLDPLADEYHRTQMLEDLRRQYQSLGLTGKLRFFRVLARHFDVDAAELQAGLAALQGAGSRLERMSAREQLRVSLEPPRLALLRHLAELPDGLRLLLDMRATLLPRAKDDADLQAVEDDLRRLLKTWFDLSILELREIDWQAPAAMLEKLMGYERVHTIASWQDMKRRLGADRRVFALFHPRLPDEPLIFVQVALLTEPASSIQAVLDLESPELPAASARCALFYSISSTQAGLARISLGNALIKQVAARLKQELPQLRTLATLSPIPGFASWLKRQPESEDLARLPALLSDGWQADPARCELLRPLLLRFCDQYLTQARRRDRAADPVANFHLSNGAQVERLNWLADVSANGLRQSHGLMVNYVYHLDRIATNRRRYAAGEIPTSPAYRRSQRG